MQFSLPLPKPSESVKITPLATGIDSMALAELAATLKQKHAKTARQPLIIITSSAFEAQRLLEEIP